MDTAYLKTEIFFSNPYCLPIIRPWNCEEQKIAKLFILERLDGADSDQISPCISNHEIKLLDKK